MGKNNGFGIIAKIILLLFGVVFFFYPLAVLFFRTIFLTLNFSLFLEIISANSHLIWNSFYQAGVSTFVSVLIGVPAAYLLVKRDFFGKKIEFKARASGIETEFEARASGIEPEV